MGTVPNQYMFVQNNCLQEKQEYYVLYGYFVLTGEYLD